MSLHLHALLKPNSRPLPRRAPQRKFQANSESVHYQGSRIRLHHRRVFGNWPSQVSCCTRWSLRPPVLWRAAHLAWFSQAKDEFVASLPRSGKLANNYKVTSCFPRCSGTIGRGCTCGCGHSSLGALSAGCKVRPNPSVEPTRSGMAPWPRGFHAYHPPRGQGATPPQIGRAHV